MKKLIVIGMLMACAAVSAFAQGTVVFQNTSTTLMRYDASVGGGLGGTPVATGTMRVELRWGVQGTAEALLVRLGSGGVDPSLGATVLVNPAGRYLGGNKTTGPGTAPGGTATFQARAWSAAFNTYEEAVTQGNSTHFAGKSALFNSLTGGAGNPPGTPVNLAPLIPVFTITQVPEPSVIALGILGIGSVLLFRRRK